MIYLTDEDLELETFERFLNESIEGSVADLKTKAEKAVIGICKTFLSSYDTDDIFDAIEPMRDEFLAKLMSIMVTQEILGRNAARKLNQDGKDDYKWALAQLEKIQKGIIQLDLPPKVDESGNSTTPLMWGNTSNQDFYI